MQTDKRSRAQNVVDSARSIRRCMPTNNPGHAMGVGVSARRTVWYLQPLTQIIFMIADNIPNAAVSARLADMWQRARAHSQCEELERVARYDL